MRNFLYWLFLISISSVYGQVKIGTDAPNASSQLEMVPQYRRVLIPQVSLSNITDQVSIAAGNVESLLVYNTTSNSEISPGYYYWHQGSWRRLHVYSSGKQGDFSETFTSLKNNRDGTYTYINEGRTETEINPLKGVGDIFFMDNKRQLAWAKSLIILIIIASGVFLYVYWKRINSRILEKQKLINRQSHTLNSQRLTIASLEKELNDPLIGLLHSAKTNDPEFLTRFYEVYPEVCDKLISLEPKLVQTELAFCAMVWLNFSTKEIARYTYVQPKSVQTKKHRLRKKLEIDSDQDLYVWFRKL